MKSRFTKEEKSQIISQYWNGDTAPIVCAEHGISSSTLYSWIKEAAEDSNSPNAAKRKDSSQHKKQYADLKRHADKLEQKLDIYEALHLKDQIPLEDKLILLEDMREDYSVTALCEVLGISKGTFHNRVMHYRDPQFYKAHRDALKEQIQLIFDESEQRYGADKILAVLIQRGVHTSKKMVLQLMREMNLQSIGVHAKKIARARKETENILSRDFDPSAPNKIWVSDITQFKTLGSIFYICVILDLYSRMVVGYKVAQSATTQLVTATFKMAYEKRKRPEGLLFHSDQGIQYTAYAFRKLLEDSGVQQSFSTPGHPHDNAVAESFFAILKREELYRRIYKSGREFRDSIDEFMDYYNTARPHRHNGYKSPLVKEEEFARKK